MLEAWGKASIIVVILFPETSSAASLAALDCDGSEQWQAWREVFLAEGVSSPRVVKGALYLWENIKWEEVVPWRVTPGERSELSASTEELMNQKPLVWNELMHGDPLMVEWISYSAALFSAVLQSGEGSQGELKAEQYLQSRREKMGMEPDACMFGAFSPYAFLMVQYTLIYYFKQVRTDGGQGMLKTFLSQMCACMEVILDIPFHTYDFIDLFWNVSSMDIAINTRTAESMVHYTSFEDYSRLNPVPEPYLPPWQFELPKGSLLATPEAHRRFVHSARSYRGHGPMYAGIVHLHDATAWDDWYSLRTAWSSMIPFSGPSGWSLPELRPMFYFTRVAGLKGCPEDPEISQRLRAPFAALKDLQKEMRAPSEKSVPIIEGGKASDSAVSPGLAVAEDFLRHWIGDGDPPLRDVDVLLCGEPVWLCPLLDRLVDRPMLVRFNMALLDEFESGGAESAVNLWWAEFYSFVGRGHAHVSVGTRFTVEQVAYQTWGSVRFPYVPFLGLHLQPPHPDAGGRLAGRKEILLFQSNLQPMLAFKMALRLAEAELPEEQKPPRIVDMNELPHGICRPEMGSFAAAVLLPHNPAPIRLVDLYAQGVIMYVPGRALIHRWIWAARPFGGFRAPGIYTAMSPTNLSNGFAAARAQRAGKHDPADEGAGSWSVGPPSVKPPEGHPPFSATAYLSAWPLQRHLPDKRYWLQYTEWELYPGVQRFESIPELFTKLRARDAAVAADVRSTMHLHMQARRADGLAWWRMALAAAGVVMKTSKT